MTPTPQSLYFQADYELEAPDFWWTLNREKVEVDYGSWGLTMDCLGDSDSGDGMRTFSRWRTHFVVTRELTVSPESYAIFSKLNECPPMSEIGVYALLDTPLPMKGWEKCLSYPWITTAFWLEVRELHKEFDRLSLRALNALFWRLGVHCGPSAIQSEFCEFSYSLTKEKFEWLPIKFNVEFGSYDAKEFDDAILTEALRFADSGNTQPLHHSLFKEAWNRRETEVRVAIVMATAAVEAAVKRLISDSVSGTEWIMENVPSPPIVKIIHGYLPTLRTEEAFDGVVLAPPKDLMKKLEDLITCRNKIAHGSNAEIPNERDLKDWLVAVRDFLWLIDYYNGAIWALRLITPKVVAELRAKAASIKRDQASKNR